MLKQHMMLALLGTALLAVPAAAQTGTGSSTSEPSASSGASTSSATGSQAGSVQFIQQAQASEWRASKLVGVDIYGPENQKVGDVDEVIVDKSGASKAIVIGVGGFLGIGEKRVAVPWNAVQWSDTPRPGATASSGGGGGGAVTGGTGATGGMTTATTGTGSSSANQVRDYPDHGMISLTRDQLKSAPDFRYASEASRDTGSRGTAR